MSPAHDNISEFSTDLIRIVATISVILVHVGAPVTGAFESLPQWHWQISNLLGAAVRPCVPLFFMLSGHLLLGKVEPAGLFFQKRLTRIALPMAFWSLFYLAFLNRRNLNEIGLTDLLNLLIEPAQYHLWFIYALIFIYLLTPLLRLIVQRSTHRQLIIVTLSWLCVASLGPILEWAFGFALLHQLDMFFGYSGFALAGYLLGRTELSPKHLWIAALTALVTYLVTAIGTSWVSNRDDAFNQNFYEYLIPWVMLHACAQFLLLRKLALWLEPRLTDRTRGMIAKVAALTFGVYLVHAAVLQVLFNRGPEIFNIFGSHPLGAIATTTLATFAISLALIWLAHRSRLIARITG